MYQPKGYETLGRIVSITVRDKDGNRHRLQFLDPVTGNGLFDHLPKDKQPEFARDDKGNLHIVNQAAYADVDGAKAKTPVKDLKGKIGRQLIDGYTALHEGAAPGEVIREQRLHNLGKYDSFGSIEDAEYWKRTKERDEHIYHHPFALPDDKQPRLVLSSRNELRIIHQDNITVTERGIEDMPSAIAPRSNRSSYRSRRNPFSMDATKRVVMSSYTAGPVAALTYFGLKYGVQAWNTKMPTKQLTGYWAAGAKALAGTGVALVADAYLPEAAAPIAAGIGVGGVASGIIDAVDTYRGTASVTQTTTVSTTTTPPAGYPYGLPQQQQQQQFAGQGQQPAYQYGPTR